VRTAFIETLCQLAEKDERIWLLTGDLGYNVLERFRDRFPSRFVNMGVAEQNMIGVATGLALSGKTAFAYSIGNFAFARCLENIRNDVCYHNANVKIVAVGGGLAYGALGYTHHAVEDLAVMRALPNITVLAPGDPVETQLATQVVANQSGPFYLRLGRADDPIVHKEAPDFKIGRPIVVRDGTDVTLVSTGGALKKVVDIADLLEQRGIAACVISMHTLKPIDSELLQSYLVKTPVVVTIEEHTVFGGVGSVVAEVLAQRIYGKCRLYCFGIDRVSVKPVEDPYLILVRSLDVKIIADRITSILLGP
jgi:transketolase